MFVDLREVFLAHLTAPNLVIVKNERLIGS